MRIILLTLLIGISVSAIAQKTNFSGTWEINKSKTNFTEARAAEWVVPRVIKMFQQPEQLTLTRTSTDNQLRDQPAVTEVLPFNGTPFQRASGGTQIVTVLSWVDDHAFTISRKGTSTAKETWRLEDDGKTLVIDRRVDSEQGSYSLKCYYDKK